MAAVHQECVGGQVICVEDLRRKSIDLSFRSELAYLCHREEDGGRDDAVRLETVREEDLDDDGGVVLSDWQDTLTVSAAGRGWMKRSIAEAMHPFMGMNPTT